MRVTVLFFAELGDMFGRRRVLEVPEGTTVGEIVALFSSESEPFSLKTPSLVYAVNEKWEPIEKDLADEDELAIMSPMSGGC